MGSIVAEPQKTGKRIVELKLKLGTVTHGDPLDGVLQ